MGIEYFLQQLVNGICLGGMYALMSVGYSLVYSIMNFSNFAHGGVIMVGAYVGYFALTALNVPFLPAFLLCGVGSGLLAIIIERLVYSPLRKRHAPSLYFIISAMGASIFLENFVIATIDGTPRNYPPIFDNRINIGGISLGVDSLLMIVVSAVALLILMFIIQKTKVGLAIRACSYSEKASTLMGINGDLVIFIIFLMGGVLAGFARYALRHALHRQAHHRSGHEQVLRRGGVRRSRQSPRRDRRLGAARHHGDLCRVFQLQPARPVRVRTSDPRPYHQAVRTDGQGRGRQGVRREERYV